jgi:3'(2'), 5'-bisphosphate nucleotidase
MVLNTKDLVDLVHQLKPIVDLASNAILEIYSDVDSFGTVYKDDESPLTKADLASNKIICEGLERLTPDISIISEENINLEYEERKNKKYLWSVDPLDGTKEFVKRNGEFTINIALLEDGIPVLGIIHLPVKDKFYYGVKNHGAFYGDVKLKADSFSIHESGLAVVASRSYISPETKAYIEKFDNAKLIPKGSAIKFIAISLKEAMLYPRFGTTMEWDTAAAQIILEEAGGMVINVETLQPLQYNKKDLRNPDFLALASMKENLGALAL